LRAFRQRIQADQLQMSARRRVALLIFKQNTGDLVGGISLADIRHGNRRSAVIGYWIGQDYTRQGHTFASIQAMLAFSFDTLNLNRIEAACQPGNIASRNLLIKAGFTREGLARDYLKINGKWRDHEIWACTKGLFCPTD